MYRSYNDPELFQKVKETVTMQQAAQYCGLQAGRNGLCLCPFHKDRHPSLKLYPNGKGFYCFTCGTGGDQIKFVSLYRGISNEAAAKELASAFHVPVQTPLSYREKREAERAMKKRREISVFAKRAERYLTVYYGLLCKSVRQRDSHFEEGLQNLSWTSYILEQLKECPECIYEDKKAVRTIGEIEGRVTDWYIRIEADGSVSR